jgi:hypothetical protein
VKYETLRDSSQPGPYRWPCLTLDGRAASTVCVSRRLMTVEEERAESEEIRAIARRVIAERDAGRCPTCGADMTERQVGPCVYAEPCGHRIGQGRAQR